MNYPNPYSNQNQNNDYGNYPSPPNTNDYGGMKLNPPYDQQQQQQRLPMNNNQNPIENRSYPRNYNEMLEQRGIPAISAEDIKILRECGRESMIYRCIPITAALCAGLMYTARVKQIQPKFYHYLGAVFCGYFTGKLSYRSVCEDKLIRSPSQSPFVQSLRKRKGLFVEGYDGNNMPQDYDPSSQSFGSMQSPIASSPYGKPFGSVGSSGGGINEIDDNRFSSSSSYYNQNRDSQYIHDPFGTGSPADDFSSDNKANNQPGFGGGSVTYDELRNRNRSAYKNL